MARRQKFDYFSAFKQQAELAVLEAEKMIATIDHYDPEEEWEDWYAWLDEAHSIEHDADGVCHDIFQALSVDFVTPIDREDIINLATTLDDILDYSEDVIQRFYMYNVQGMHPRAREYAEILCASCTYLRDAMDSFAALKPSEKLTEMIIKVNDCEEAADRLYGALIHDLYENSSDAPVHIMKWETIFNKMEKCTDACEHAADTIRGIILKGA